MGGIPLCQLEGEPLIPVVGGEGAGLWQRIPARSLLAASLQGQHHALHVLVSRRHEPGDPAVLPLAQGPLEGTVADPGILTDQAVEAGLQPALVMIAGGRGEQQVVAKVIVGGVRSAHGPEGTMVRHLALVAVEQQIGGKTGVIFHDEAPAHT